MVVPQFRVLPITLLAALETVPPASPAITRPGNSSSVNSGTCNNSIVIPVFQSAAQALASSSTSARLLTALDGGFGLQWFASDTLCEQCLTSRGQCGYDQNNSNGFTCYCPDQPQARQCSVISGSTNGLKLGIQLATGLASSLVPLIIVSIIVVYCRKKSCKATIFWKMETANDQNVEAIIRNYGSLAPKRFHYSDVKKMTNSFKDKLGQGGYGGVYKGKLPDGRLMAVKVLSETKDVYSYGMMVLEMVGGRENIELGSVHTSETYFPDWIYEQLEHGKDILIHGVTTEEEGEIARKMILVSLWCIQTNPSDRPSMSKVLEMLEGSLQSLQIPPKPFLYSPTRPTDSTEHSSVSLV
ncbi:hypothetical protein F0562_005301 [Nyssa sinensis]|uniref:Wall-associated receptor kinase C-terminal domain-containing protein n=1 Tax=Nyssa sinensis TaxID=561372 RepID=A0A5J5AL99_9ASTE|nr:hypothetical protein F0562_005301 [Nyssa sinensis]